MTLRAIGGAKNFRLLLPCTYEPYQAATLPFPSPASTPFSLIVLLSSSSSALSLAWCFLSSATVKIFFFLWPWVFFRISAPSLLSAASFLCFCSSFLFQLVGKQAGNKRLVTNDTLRWIVGRTLRRLRYCPWLGSSSPL